MEKNTFSGSKILIIDDEPIMLENMAVYLEDSGFSVIQCLDGKTGLEAFTSQQPDLVLLDLNMPLMDGREVCRFTIGLLWEFARSVGHT